MKRERLRRPLPKVPEDMKAWSASLAQELSSWPEVVAKPMFGMLAFYRGRRIFACVPRVRAFYSPNTVIFKFDPLPPKLAERAQDDARITAETAFAKRAGWLAFEIGRAVDLRDVLWWLDQAYRAARCSG